MKKNEKKELHQKTVEELSKMVKEAKEALFTLKMDIMRSKEKNMTQVSTKKDDIARMLTIINEKQSEEKGEVKLT